MAHDFLDGFDIGLIFTKLGGKSMTDVVAGESRNQKRFPVLLGSFYLFFCVVIVDDPQYCLIDQPLMKWCTVSAAENKATHAVDFRSIKPYFLLMGIFRTKSVFHIPDHGNDPVSFLALRCADMEPAGFFSRILPVDQCMVYADLLFLQINIFPPEPGHFRYSHAGAEKDYKQGQPMIVGRTPFHIIQKSGCLLCRKRRSFFHVPQIAPFEFSHEAVCGIGPDNAITDCHRKDRMDQSVDILNSHWLYSLFHDQLIVVFADIGIPDIFQKFAAKSIADETVIDIKIICFCRGLKVIFQGNVSVEAIVQCGLSGKIGLDSVHPVLFYCFFLLSKLNHILRIKSMGLSYWINILKDI